MHSRSRRRSIASSAASRRAGSSITGAGLLGQDPPEAHGVADALADDRVLEVARRRRPAPSPGRSSAGRTRKSSRCGAAWCGLPRPRRALGRGRVLAPASDPTPHRVAAEVRDLLGRPHEQHEHPVFGAGEDQGVGVAGAELDQAVAPLASRPAGRRSTRRPAPRPFSRAAVGHVRADPLGGRRPPPVGAHHELAVDLVLRPRAPSRGRRRAAGAPEHVDERGPLAHLGAGLARRLHQRLVEAPPADCRGRSRCRPPASTR